jgi:hypothetical protein
MQYDIADTLGNGSWGYIVGTYERRPARSGWKVTRRS